jgi:hypothetical protein
MLRLASSCVFTSDTKSFYISKLDCRFSFDTEIIVHADTTGVSSGASLWFWITFCKFSTISRVDIRE